MPSVVKRESAATANPVSKKRFAVARVAVVLAVLLFSDVFAKV